MNADLHDHYGIVHLTSGHEPSCRLVTATVNWPTIFGLPPCTCRVGGNTVAAEIAYRASAVAREAVR